MKNAEVETQRLMMKGILSEMPAEDQAKVKQAMEALSQVVTAHGDHGFVALTMLGLELARDL